MFVFDGKEPVGSGCVAQVYRAKARVKSVEDLAFQKLVEELEKNNLLEAWEIPGLGGALSDFWETYEDEEETADTRTRGYRERPGPDQHLEEERLIPVAIKVKILFTFFLLFKPIPSNHLE